MIKCFSYTYIACFRAISWNILISMNLQALNNKKTLYEEDRGEIDGALFTEEDEELHVTIEPFVGQWFRATNKHIPLMHNMQGEIIF